MASLHSVAKQEFDDKRIGSKRPAKSQKPESPSRRRRFAQPICVIRVIRGKKGLFLAVIAALRDARICFKPQGAMVTKEQEQHLTGGNGVNRG
jgi:hypothetical protein